MRHGISILESSNIINNLNIKIMKKFNEMTDSELVWWFIHFLNGGNWEDPEDRALYEAACDEADTRSEETQKIIAHAHEVI